MNSGLQAQPKLIRRIDYGRELLVLGIVRRQPQSAYAIDRAVRNHTALYRGLGQGNIYDFVGRLAQAGYLSGRRSKTERGRADSKLVYRLTARGEGRFQEMLRSVICDVDASDSALEIVLVLLGQLRRRDASRLLAKRKRELLLHARRLGRLFGDPCGRSGAATLASTHAEYRVQNEQRFVGDILRLVDDPRWHPEWE